MAKTIKFNLLLDDNPVRDIKGLQDNFCIDDILEVYENGLLQKWLKVRGFDEHLEKVKNITKDNSIIVQLLKIFDIQKDDAEIRESIYSLEFQENRKKSLQDFNSKNDNLKKRIEEYHNDYEELIKSIIKQKENMAFLKMASKEISDKYFKLFELDYKDSYELYKEKSPFMIYAILMNNRLSFLFMRNNTIKEDLYQNFMLQTKLKSVECSKCKGTGEKTFPNDIERRKALNSNLWANNFSVMNDNTNYIESLNSLKEKQEKALELIKEHTKLIEFKGKTDAYWKDLEIADTKVMILSIPNDTFIRSANDLKQELSANDVNGNFFILDGLAYKSNNSNKSIIYMKV
ncbi:hypothetical protein MNB_SV-9-634 [hydrothermal vent metagenome]|uniref:Uncharacterized protein n=1 Tax=hydrothermal vent metagenome TaxID=652676 RepID=A0A1W1C5S1_9ZZZZ